MWSTVYKDSFMVYRKYQASFKPANIGMVTYEGVEKLCIIMNGVFELSFNSQSKRYFTAKISVTFLSVLCILLKLHHYIIESNFQPMHI